MKGFYINGEERQLFWALLQHDSWESVNKVVAGLGTHQEKTSKIISQLDFVFQIRLTLANTPASGGGIWVGELPQKYLIGMMTRAQPETLSLELRVLFYKYRDGLLFKLSDTDRAQVGVEAASESDKDS